MILAMFATEADLAAALQRCRADGIGALETFSPAPLEGEPAASPIPLVILIAGLAGGAASFALQSYSALVAYPFKVGGRPDFAWPSFIPTAFENAVLLAIVAGFVAFMIINRLPRLYDPVDESETIQRASRDRWFLQVNAREAAMLARARTLLHELHPITVEDLPG